MSDVGALRMEFCFLHSGFVVQGLRKQTAQSWLWTVPQEGLRQGLRSVAQTQAGRRGSMHSWSEAWVFRKWR
jgi:hypothetical protein